MGVCAIMDVIGVVCEYNPFHRGHEYHLMMSRRALGGNTPVICVMSGDFVQRGEPAAFSKFARAEAACLCGADLVVELPLPWSLSSAEGFARGSVALISALGATHLSFGSETGEVEPLETITEVLLDPFMTAEIKKELSGNASLSFAAARQKVLERHIGELSEQIKLPNNILAVEYIKAIYELDLDLRTMTVQRFGSGHDMSGTKGPKSASELRGMLAQGRDVSEYIPENALKVFLRETENGRGPLTSANYENALISRLRMLPEEIFETLPDSGDGLGRRLFAAVQKEPTVNAVLAAAKTKRYALARLRRICMCAALGIKEGMNKGIPPYARVLAANARGCELLKAAKDRETVNIVTKPASVRTLGSECTELFAAGASAHDLFVLGYRAEKDKKGGEDWRTGPKIV